MVPASVLLILLGSLIYSSASWSIRTSCLLASLRVIIFSINRLIVWSVKHYKTVKNGHHNM